MIESLDGVMPKFLQGILAPVKPKPVVETIKDDEEEEEDEKKPDGKIAKIWAKYQSVFTGASVVIHPVDTTHACG